MLHAGAIHRQRQQLKVGLSEFGTLFQHANGKEKISIAEKWATEARHGARIWQGEHNCQTRAADLKNEGPRYPLLAGYCTN